MYRKLVRKRRDKVVAGVCSGIAEYFNIDPTMVRLITALLFFAGTISLWLYIIAAIIIPAEY